MLVAGCFWRSYGARMTTHADVLVGMARKAVDLVVSGRMTAETMPELTYPLERAQAFAAEAKTRSGAHPPPSLVAFEELVAHYRDLVDHADRARRDGKGEAARERLASDLAAVERATEAVRATLATEDRLSDRGREGFGH
jgi:hypothetical protein